jgi:uncharacterized membrane protein YhaH (DUF805 family)
VTEIDRTESGWVVSFWNYLFSPRGRINRAKYWLYLVASMVTMAAVLIAVVTAIRAGLLYDPRGPRAVPPAALAILAVVFLLVFIVGIFVGIKRLHDRDKSAWWLLVLYLTPMVGSWIAAMVSHNGYSALIVTTWVLFELGWRRGTVGPNRYGEDPLAGRVG